MALHLFGYRLKPGGVLVPDKTETLIVKEIFESFISGETIANISKKFNINPRRIGRILKNVIYIGKLKLNESEMINDKRVYHKNHEIEIIDGKHEPIIEKDIFLLANSLRRKTTKYKDGTFILTNVYCWNGERMYPSSNKRQQYYSTKYSKCFIDRDFLEKIVLENILSFNFDKLNEDIEAIDYQEQKEFYSKELSKFKENESKILKKYLDGYISENIFDKFIEDKKRNIKETEDKIKEINNLILNNEKKEDNAKLLTEYINALKKTKDRAKLAQILNILVSEIRMINNFRCVVITTIF